MPSSDISGAVIDGDAGETMVGVFADGTRRQLTLTRDEATHLRAQGVDQTTWWRRAIALVRTNAKRFMFWALALFIGSLAVPAATKQWSDRQQANAVRAEIIKEISIGSAQAFATSKYILEVAPKDTPKRRLATRFAWERVQGDVDARYAVYFARGSPAREAWSGYRDAMYDYISMLCCDEFIETDVSKLRPYVSGFEQRKYEGEGDPWEVLARCGGHTECTDDTDFVEAHKWAGLALLNRRGPLLDALRSAQPDGFSNGWRDFVRDALRPLHG